MPNTRKSKRYNTKVPVVTEKLCPSCTECKPASEFHKKVNSPTGLTTYCKPCKSKIDYARRQTPRGKAQNYINVKLWKQANPERSRELNRQSYLRMVADPEKRAHRLAKRKLLRQQEKLKLFKKLRSAQPEQRLYLKLREYKSRDD